MWHIHYQNITAWIHLHPQWGGLAAFIIAFAESLAIVGSIVPGSVTMTAIGILAGSGVLPIWFVLICSILGAIIGDGLSYYLGYHFKGKLQHCWPFRKYPQILTKGEIFFLKHGGKSVFIGRFVGAVRAIVPIVAGMLKMPPKRYFTVSVPSAILWAPIYMLPGILLGAVSLEMPAHVAAELIGIVLLVLIALWVIFWIIRQIYRKTRNYFNRILDRHWEIWATQRSKRWICTLLRNGEHPERHGQLLISCVVVLLGILFLVTWGNEIWSGPLTHWNPLIYHFFRGLRTPTLDKVATVITFFGYKYILLPVIATLGIWLLLRKKFWAAAHWFFVGIATAAAAFIVKHIYYHPRPHGNWVYHASSSFPSGHTILSVAIYGFIAFLIAYKRPKGMRKLIYWIAVIICLTIATSRLYLGMHWLSDILGSLSLGLCLLYLTIISYRREKTLPIPMLGILVISIATILIGVGFDARTSFKKELVNNQAFWHVTYVSQKDWWNQTTAKIPPYRLDRFGQPDEVLNVQWAGSIDAIQKTLLLQGWHNNLYRSYLTTLIKILEEHQEAHQTLLPRLYQDQQPYIEMIKFMNNQSPPLILRLWRANIILQPHSIPLWIGSIYYDLKRPHHLPFLNEKLGPLFKVQTSKFLQSSLTALHWQYQLIPTQPLPKNLRYYYPNQLIILIQPMFRGKNK